MANCMYQKERYVLMSKNTNLHQAKSARCDEFFTKKECIEAEIKYYWNHFKGKIVYCNCDDPYESEFFKYFMIRFEMLGLKGLYATCYEGSQMSQHQLQLFEDEEYKIKVEQAKGEKCERCWMYSTTVGEDKENPTICHKCSEALK